MLESPYFEVGSGQRAVGAVDDLIADLNAEILEAHAGSAPGLQRQWRTLGDERPAATRALPFLAGRAGFAGRHYGPVRRTLQCTKRYRCVRLLANRSALATPLLRRVLSLAWYCGAQ